MAAAEQGTDLVHVVALLGRGGGRRSAVQARRARLGAGLPGRRPGDRPVRAEAVHQPAGDPACRRARRGDVPVHHRARDAAVAAVEPAAGDLRARRRAGRHLRRADHRRRRPRSAFRRWWRSSPPWASCSPRPPSSMQILEERGDTATPAGPAAGVDPAARGPRHRAAAGAGRVPGAVGVADASRRRHAGLRSASRSPPSRRWWRRGNGCSIRCSACSPMRRRAR